MTELLQDPDENVRIACCESVLILLEGIDTTLCRRVVTGLVDLLKDTVPDVRTACTQSLASVR